MYCTQLSKLFFPVLLFSFLLVASGCDEREQSEEPVLAKVHDRELTFSQISKKFNKKMDEQDSIRLLNQLTDRWIRENILLHKAELNLNEEEKDFKEQLESYHNSLLIYAFESKYIAENLDTTISEEEIVAFYEKNKENFKLKDHTLKGIYMKVDKNLSILGDIEELLKDPDEKAVEELSEFASKYATNYMLDKQEWLYFKDLSQEIPFELEDVTAFIKNAQFEKIEDEYFYYYLTVLDYRLKSAISPLEMERDKIKELIMNNRKKELIKSMRNDLVNRAFVQKNAAKFIKE